MGLKLNSSLGIGGGGGGGVVAGQVVQFKEGQVPEGYAQISGPAFSPSMAGIFAADSTYPKIGDVFRIVNAGGRLFALVRGASASVVQELTGDLTPIGSAVTMPSTTVTYWYTGFIPLLDGNILRIGGGGGTDTTTVHRYNTASKSFTQLASTPTPMSAVCNGVQAASGKVFVNKATALSMYDPATNTWTDTFDTLPTTSFQGFSTLPSGKLLAVFSAAQYIFDPAAAAGARWTQVGSYPAAGGCAIATASGARVYSFTANTNGVGNCVAFYDFNESTLSWVATVTGILRPHGVLTVGNSYWLYATGIMQAIANPYNGATILRTVGTNEGTGQASCYQHYLTYTPAATVSAVKL